ncbi:MAG TPA: transcription antitermination factor NusB [Acidimicrobiales bacterium]|nr:transcription antitermination factor NusB [Acidimicrobiales bacterium]
MTAPARGPRALALRALTRIDEDGGYANLVLAAELGRTELDRRDRALVTALVNGTTRMQRACDHLVDRYLQREIDPDVRRILRLGAYQLVFMQIPPHAAVSATVSLAPRRVSGLINAVLRRVSEHPLDPGDPTQWPDEATRLSYPDWIVERLTADLGSDDAVAALTAMNVPAPATTRDDGYVQDAASQAVVDVVGATPDELVVDLCAAPGGKATALAGDAKRVIALDHTSGRVGLIVANAATTGVASRLDPVVADGRQPPLRPGCADAVLLDAPCSGLGSLRRRADARWRITAADVDSLAALQAELLVAAAALVRPGGRLVYSVCTLTEAETDAVAARFVSAMPAFVADPLGDAWKPAGVGARLMPTVDGRDGMSCFRFRRSSTA